ncbi:helix-turn-helix transcriptional regulator [Cytobacillus sp. IB215316]|uniref:helix-turn-helix transcriptional regulator n=1 Tax=Cytobacillus sp. IB215316 TaxID=3097354 RepID=UPI002A106DE8|nr:helix-turn-helix transcriptional regulator [Cytobacillus sp. IB215316]MDX8361508.1 helix-turn-helix transcriptional regulator [Cytobacillus sp. IB215316]
MKVGERIRQLRIHKRLTQKELVENICSITYLSRIENGDINPSSGFLEKVARRLGISEKDLLIDDLSEKGKKITDIFNLYKEKQSLSEENLSFLSMNSKETYPTYILTKLFSILIRYYTSNGQLDKSKEFYQLSTLNIPKIVDPIYSEDFQYYFVSCGIFFYSSQLYNEANTYFTQAEQIMTHEENLENASLYYNISLVKQRVLEDKSICLYYSKKAHEILNNLDEHNLVTRVLITRGVQYHLIKDFSESLRTLNEANQYIDQNGDKKLYGMIRYNLGRVYQGMKNYEEAIKNFNESIKINKNLDFEEENIYSLRSLSEIYLEKKQWDIAHSLLEESLLIAEAKQLNYMMLELKSIKARSSLLRGDEYTYEKEMQKIIVAGIEQKQGPLVKQLAKELAQHYYNVRSYKKSADYFKIALEEEKQLASEMLTKV